MISPIHIRTRNLILNGFAFFCFFYFNNLSAQVLQNYGSVISAKSGSVITVNGSVLNEAGTIDINQNAGTAATMYVSQDVTNNSTIFADGHIHLSGNWFDNGSFESTLGTVFMDGATQFLGGSSATIFHNLSLNGSEFKIQQVNKFATGVLSLNHLELKTETFSFFMENTALNAITRTTGFVSSLNGGFLGRQTNSNGLYLYPVGSSDGVIRYRPVELTPENATPNQYMVRFANTNATLEGYDLSMHEIDICDANTLFYHQIARTAGIAAADVVINYDPVSDGSWSSLSRWNLSSPLWEKITGSFTSSGMPFFKAQKTNWSNFSDIPYVLTNQIVAPIFSQVPPVCFGDVIPPLPTTSLNGITGTWSPAINNTDTTTYTFTPGIDQCGYAGIITITVNPLPISTFSGSPLTGCIPLEVTLLADDNSNTSYSWSASNGLTGTGAQSSLSFTSGGFYDITLTTGLNGCFTTTTLNDAVVVQTPPIASFFPFPFSFSEATQLVDFTNTSIGANSYSWDFGNGASSTETNPNHIFTDNTNGHTITLVAASTMGCTSTYQISIEFDEDLIYYIPNTFTPDGDGHNQTFKPVFTSGFDPYNYEMLIYNRWGEIIFETHDVTYGWDGTYALANYTCQDGVYLYKIIFKNPLSDERKVVCGSVTLLK
jgi:gliding motility-associated-like protein